MPLSSSFTIIICMFWQANCGYHSCIYYMHQVEMYQSCSNIDSVSVSYLGTTLNKMACTIAMTSFVFLFHPFCICSDVCHHLIFKKLCSMLHIRNSLQNCIWWKSLVQVYQWCHAQFWKRIHFWENHGFWCYGRSVTFFISSMTCILLKGNMHGSDLIE